MPPLILRTPLFFLTTSATALLLSLSLRAEPFVVDASRTELPTMTIAPSVAKASDATESLAIFASVMKKIVGAAPAEGDSLEAGIVFATAEEFPQIAREAGLDTNDPLRREEYLLRTSGRRLLVVGATPIAVRRAMADILHRWGYRQFFPSADWEVLPPPGPLSLDADAVERPAFAMRDLFTTSYLETDKEATHRWLELNRMGRGFLLNTRHSYKAIYKRHQATFDAHPEYFGMVNGKRQVAGKTEHFKFNVVNDELLRLIEEDAREQFKQPDAVDSISMDPSDFGGWDDSGEAFEALGKPTNQAVTLANHVAKTVAAPLERYVGMYAYYDHQFPPDIEVEPNVIVSFATRFLRPGEDLYRNIAAWREKGVKQVGIREYASVFLWDLALPGRALGGNVAYLEETLPRYQKLGATFYTSEMTDAWGAYGLGYYLTSQLLWNPQQDASAIVADFLSKAFGPAAVPMQEFFTRLNGADSVMVRFHTAAWLYAPLVEALSLANGDVQVEKRIVALLAYVRYVELFSRMERLPRAEKQAALDELYDHLYRTAPLQILPTHTMMLAARSGLRQSHPTLSHPGQSDSTNALAEAAARPVNKKEFLAYAKDAIARGSNTTLPQSSPLLRPAKVAPPPWIRNSAAFTFVLNAGEKTEAEIAVRRFGFSGFPRYLVLGPAKAGGSMTILQRGQMQQEKESIALSATVKGNYTIVFEPTPNLIQCRATLPYYLNANADTGAIDFVSYQGTLHLAIPQGTPAAIAIGGQGKEEKVFASIVVDDMELFEGGNLDGIYPLEQTIDAPKGAPARVRIPLRNPGDGYFEDYFIQFQNTFTTPVSLSPLP